MIKEGFLLSPFYVFIKGISTLHDELILEMLGLECLTPIEAKIDLRKALKSKNHIFMATDDDWTHIMDNYRYSLWDSSQLISKIEIIAKRYDIFCCCIGDTDSSFNFTYYKNGNLVRKYTVEAPDYNNPILMENIGSSLSGEEKYLDEKKERNKVLSLAKSIGVKVIHDIKTLRCYKYK